MTTAEEHVIKENFPGNRHEVVSAGIVHLDQIPAMWRMECKGCKERMSRMASAPDADFLPMIHTSLITADVHRLWSNFPKIDTQRAYSEFGMVFVEDDKPSGAIFETCVAAGQCQECGTVQTCLIRGNLGCDDEHFV